MDFEFDAAAIAGEYAAGAARYAEAFGDNLEVNEFDRAVLENVLSDVPTGGAVLDAGCGPGQGAAFAESRGYRAIALDITAEMLEVARARLRGPVVHGDLRSLPFRAATFDAVIAWYSLLHLPESALPDALRGIRRTLRRDGKLVAAFQGNRDPRVPDRAPWSDYRANEITPLLKEAGFVDVVARTRPPRAHEYQATKVVVSGRRP